MNKLLASVCLLACIAGGIFFYRKTPLPLPSRQIIIARSRVATGDLTRLARVMARARRGEPVSIGFIGGSITCGEGATRPDRGYASLVADWWARKFPQSKITLVNAGIYGTTSTYGCLRVQRDLLSAHPDFVVVEFSVNDHDDLAHAQTYEGVVRQILADPRQPAVALLFLMHHDGTPVHPLEAEVGRNYGLPMISYRDALWPEIEAGRMKWSDITADPIHPNDRGHAAIAAFLESLLQDAAESPSPPHGDSSALPPPRFTDLFAHTHLLEADQLQPVTCRGWVFDPADRCWKSGTPGSVIEFEITGSAIDLLYARVSSAGGTVSVTIDDSPSAVCDAWFDGSWAGLCQTDTVGSDLSNSPHVVRIELIEGKNKLSSGHEFRILGIGTAGHL